ncbi:hypothetical protein C440_05697 [Haloferax mucosum ATCC BAA-1512]|uniref:Uncharacterized protein n=1 Tax=Haloferax mucosum ATCC BAA-1512 TaxID=662479 RepID=M0IKU1_9EURY|nr:hypothetical protein [Haloferax mucosum]ELZ96059.1 hypothetical protein C440_05697 [Haloferax mucosum ATCC BAA-1512]
MVEVDWVRTGKAVVRVLVGFSVAVVVLGVLFAYFQSLAGVVLFAVALAVAYYLFKRYIAGTHVSVNIKK